MRILWKGGRERGGREEKGRGGGRERGGSGGEGKNEAGGIIVSFRFL